MLIQFSFKNFRSFKDEAILDLTATTCTEFSEHVRASGGEKVLLKMAILMQHKVNLLILDEPTNHIDIETREILEDALSNYSGTLLFVSHDRYFIDKLAQRKLVIENNTINSVYCDYK